MSKLELQLSTAKAQAQLAQVEKSIASLSGALQGIGRSTTEFDRLVRSMSSFKGINRTTVTNIEKMNVALRGMRVPTGLGKLGTSLSAIASVNLRGVASSLGTFAKNLDRIKIPKNLQTISNQLLQIGNAANMAAMGMERFKTASTGIRAPRSLNTINRQMAKMPGSFSAASNAAMGFNNTIRTARNLAAGFGATLGVFGFAQFVKASTDAVNVVDRFNVVMTQITGSTEGAQQALGFVRSLVDELALDMRVTTQAFQKFAAASVSSGNSMEKTQMIFKNFSTAFRVMNLSAEDSKLAFLALEQMISKGRVQTEELRRQLGERVPGAMALMAKSLGVGVDELDRMLRAGEVSSAAVEKLAVTLNQAFGSGVPAAINTAQAAIARMSTAFFNVQEAFGRAFWDAAKDSVNGLATAMQSPAFLDFAKSMGYIAGTLAGALADALAFVAENTWAVHAAAAALTTIGLGVMFGSITGLLKLMISPMMGVVRGIGLMYGSFIALGGVTGVLNAVRLAVVGVNLAAKAFARTPLGIVMTGLSIAAVAAAEHFGLFEKAAVALGISSKGTADSVEKQADATKKVEEAQKGAYAHLVRTDAAVLKTGQTFKASATNIAKFGEGTTNTVDELNEFERAALEAGINADKMAVDIGKAAAEQTNVADSSAVATNQLKRTANAAEEARKKYEALARAAREAASAMRSADGGGIRAGAQRKGGMAGAAVQSQAVSASAFKNAPQFAEGTANTNAYMPTVPGGGIPSILHPNEAVVPLSGGRSIPVQIKSGPAGSSASFSGTNDREVVSQLIRIVDVLNSIQAGGGVPAMSSNGRVGGTIGGSFSIGASTGSRSRSVGTMSAKDRIDSIAAKRKEIEDRRKAEADALNALTSIEDTLVETKDVIKNSFNSLTPIQQMTDMLRRANRQLTQGRGAAGGGAGTLASAGMGDLSGRLEGSSMASFSRGSPNAFNEAQGRSATVRIHPDEAVIPLPNGRAVPVTFPAERAGGGYSGGHPGGTGSTQNVEIGGITIMANNPREFEESSAQMEAKVRQRMARAVSRRGLTEGPR
jgi:tape measure domain-containing protein